jgi:hypothetical protein
MSGLSFLRQTALPGCLCFAVYLYAAAPGSQGLGQSFRASYEPGFLWRAVA